MLKIKEALEFGREELKSARIDNPLNEAILILAYILDKDKIYLYTNSHERIDQTKLEIFKKSITKRCKGMPFSYIINYKEFMSLDFYVNENVLIPRPDTEILVEKVLEFLKEEKNKVVLLDIGTGSGCIPISLAYYNKNISIVSVDISLKSLEVAKINAKKYDIYDRIEFKQSNIFENLNGYKFDYIVSNPPYIPSKDILILDKDVRNYEPKLALDGGQTGLYFYEQIVNNANKFLNVNGKLFFEIGYNQGDEVKNIMSKYFKEIEIIKDISKNNRIVHGKIV